MMSASSHSLHSLRGDAGQEVAAKLNPWVESELLLPGEVALAARLAALAGEPSFPLLLAFALALRADRRGSAHVDLAALDVQRLLDDREKPPAVEVESPSLPGPWSAWREELQRHRELVWAAEPGLPSRTVAPAPFVLEDSRLYTARAWSAESRVAAGVLRLVEAEGGLSGAARPRDPENAWSGIEEAVLTLIEGDGAEQQRMAARSAVSQSRLQVVTGGPGTGKTYTVRAMLTLAWLRRALETGGIPTLDVRLAAPTGKAAQRMKEAMSDSLPEWCRAVRDAVPEAALPAPLRDPDELEVALKGFLSSLAASTLHRLLGYQYFNPTRFRHDRYAPFAADLVVVDEASMVDLTMMAHLFDAIGDDTRLVLVGDRRQLASVETGTVLADLCAWGSAPGRPLVELNVSRRFPADSPVGRFAVASEKLDALDPPTAGQGAESVREAADEAVRILAAAAEAGVSAEAQRLGVARADMAGVGLGDPEGRGGATSSATKGKVVVRWCDRETPSDEPSTPATADTPRSPSTPPGLEGELDGVADQWVEIMRALDACPYRLAEDGTLSPICEAAAEKLAKLVRRSSDRDELTPSVVIARLAEQVRVLAAHRNGRRGVSGLNEQVWKRIREKLGSAEKRGSMRALPTAMTSPFIGKPIIVTRNDYGLGRFNGDVGLWASVERVGRGDEKPTLLALFPREGGGVSAHTSARLPEHEVVWAMTVHKSQGSEFAKVIFVLPERATSLWTRELVYTGITRVREELVLVGAQDVLVEGLAQRIRRASGLQDRLAQ